jgi:ferredoxin--NADP+ reductase
MANWLEAEIVENRQWNERLFSLRFRAPLAGFKAGQFIRVALDIDGERVARPYSLVNSPLEDTLEIFFNIVDEGPLTPRLARMQAGERLWITDKANGFLTVSEVPDARELWMLATGTGVGPFLSILNSPDAWQRFDKVVLCYSVRSADELCYRERIDAVRAQRAEQFAFVPVITRESVAGALTSRVTELLASGELEAAAGAQIKPDSSHVMMCGNSAMIADASELLKQRGLRKHLRREPGHITTEKYH